FAHELFPGLSDSFTGIIEIGSTQAAAVIALRLTVNLGGEQVLTTLPVADMTRLTSSTSMTFPHVINGQGFSTRLLFINTATGRTAAGQLSFYESSGAAMLTSLTGKPGTEFAYRIAGGGGKQLLPWNTEKVVGIELIDAFSNRSTREVVVNEGNKAPAILRVSDSSGSVRDDFDVGYTSLSPEIAAVDPATGQIEGKKAGFSTLTVESGGVLSTGTITVVGIDAGVAGFGITGIAQDLSRRLYLANTSEHTILRTESLQQAPQPYAGVAKTPGLKNDVRDQALFRNPAFLAFDQSEGNLFVADGANHVIRKVPPGVSGRVETLAGSGEGSKNGSLTEAAFRNPQGIQLDTRGNLWVVDTGNHTIRKVNLATRMVETIAGRAGSSGWVDGTGDEARFNSPRGIALETESLAQQLDRMTRGEPPPPVSLLVADTGNGVIRRVSETGSVQTIGSGGASAAVFRSSIAGSVGAPSTPLLFDSPEGIAVDSSRNVFVTEPGTGRVKTVLPTGDVVAAAQASTFRGPKGLAITQTGRVVVAESDVSAREIVFGKPQVTSITPSRVSHRGGAIVTIKGKNFAPDTRVVIVGKLIANAQIVDTETISATVPALSNGAGTVTVENRGGIAQAPLVVDAVPLSQLQPGQITTVAGGTTYFGDGGAATAASLSDPFDIAVDAFGNLLIADTFNHRIRRVHAGAGGITTIAGTGSEGFSGDRGPAVAAQLRYPQAVAVDAAGNLLIADTSNHRIRRVDAATGIITTVAGSNQGYAGDREQAAMALLNLPVDIALDAAGNLFISDNGNHCIRRIDASGIITTFAGTGAAGASADGVRATLAQLRSPAGIALDGKSNLFIADSGNHRIRRVEAGTETITTVAGSGQQAFGDGPAAAARFSSPRKIAFDREGNLLIADSSNHRIRKLSLSSNMVTTVAGTGAFDFFGDDGPAAAARLNYPEGVAVDASGNILIADTYNDRIRLVSAKTVSISTIVGIGQTTLLGDGGPATLATLNLPEGIAIDRAGNLIIADTRHNKVRKVDLAAGTISTIAGTGQKGFAGDDELATSAHLFLPSGVAVDPEGNILVVDSLNKRVRKLTVATGIITTVAGSGDYGYDGDGDLATQAKLRDPTGIAVDAAGNFFVADINNHRVRKIDALSRIITNVAGNGTGGFSRDDIQAADSQLNYPYGVAVDASGNLLIADRANGRIRKVSASGIITTVAGNGSDSPPMDNVLATEARLTGPHGVLADSAGNLFIADTFASRIRRVDAETKIITTIAGGRGNGFAGDGGAATAAQVQFPTGLALGLDGTLFVADTYNSRIRAIRGFQ
ncbi:MAG: IPT/TIG domain-containing protein, partial [Acidobacteria bacterium]|nr:IPT/TIG domain-containing protein [Acidobacteriota bacterium]